MRGKATRYIILFIVILLFNFALPRMLPGSPISMIVGEDIASMTELEKQQVLAQYNLDKPLPTQFLLYLKSFFTGDFGMSFSKKIPVEDVLKAAIPWTLLLAGSSLLFSLIVGTLLGAWSIALRHKRRDLPFMVGTSLFGSFPTFWIGIVLIAVFGVKLGWFPIYGAYSMWEDLTGLAYVLDVAKHLILPLITMSFGSIIVFLTTSRASLWHVLGEDYIKMAEIRGLSKTRIRFFYWWRNAMIPVVTLLLLNLGQILGGSVVVEAVFSYPGLGRVLYDAVLARDYPLMQYSFLIISIMVLVSCFIADILHPILDPRVKSHA